MTYLRRTACGMFLGMLALRCGGEGPRESDRVAASDRTTEPADPVPLGELDIANARALCNYKAACRPQWDYSLFGCEAEPPESVSGNLQERVAQALGRGTLVYDPQRVGDCLAAVATLDCRAEPEWLPDCPGALEGTVALGDVCVDDLDCAGDASCMTDVVSCLSRCVARPKLGESCANTPACTRGTYCADTDSPPWFRCRLVGGLRQSCDYLAECVGALECRWSTHTCVVPQRVGLGDRCDNGEGRCPDGSFCAHDTNDGSVEHCVGPAEAGGPCYAAQPTMCPEGQFCKRDPVPGYSGTCSPPTVEGDPCVTDLQCSAGRCLLGVCTTPRENGAACTVGDQCSHGDCVDGVCVAYPSCTPSE